MKYYSLTKTPITEVGCGTVVPFTPRTETVTILVPEGLARPEQVETMIVRGPSLTDHGIYDGDILAYRTNFTNKSITPDSVCVVRVVSTNELLAKKIIVIAAEKLALRSSGGGLPDRYFDLHDIEVIGLVFAAQKGADRYGRFDHTEQAMAASAAMPRIKRTSVVALIEKLRKPPEEFPF